MWGIGMRTKIEQSGKSYNENISQLLTVLSRCIARVVGFVDHFLLRSLETPTFGFIIN